MINELGFGIADYIFWGFTTIAMLFVYISAKEQNPSGALSIIVLFSLLSFPFIFYYKIDNGKYLAHDTKIRGLVIGKGTEESKRYPIVIEKENLYIGTAYNLAVYKLNIRPEWYRGWYTKKYIYDGGLRQEKSDYITLTLFGSVMLHNYDGDIIKKIKIHY